MGSYRSLTESNQAADTSNSDQAPDEPVQECPLKCWIEIELLNEDGTPVPNEPYWVKPPLMDVRKGTLDAKGQARIEKIMCGICLVRFPNMDDDDFEMVAQGGGAGEARNNHWIELELLDEANQPVGNEVFEINDAAGRKHRGKLDGKGQARVESLAPGQCTVRFPALDHRDWA